MLANSEPLIKEIIYVTRRIRRSILPMYKVTLTQESDEFVQTLQSLMKHKELWNVEALGKFLFTLYGNDTLKDDPVGFQIKNIRSELEKLWNTFNKNIPIPEALTESKLSSYLGKPKRKQYTMEINT